MTTRSIMHRARTLLGLPPRHEPKPPSQPHWRSLLGLERRPIRTVIDVGAYDGDTAKFFRRQFPEATVHCFEPQPKQFRALQQWAETQDGRVTCHPQALGETNGSAILQSYPQMPRYASIRSATDAWTAEYSRTRPLQAVPIEIQVRRLDDMMSELSLVDDVLIKIDTEGFEREVLRGGMDVVARASACIVEVSLEQRFSNQTHFRDLLDLLGTAGMHYVGNVHHGILQSGDVGFFDALFMRPMA